MNTEHPSSDYEQIREDFQWDRPTSYNFATAVVDRWALSPQKRALAYVTESGEYCERTFSEISIESKKLAAGLYSMGLRRGDTLLLILSREVEWWVCMIACIRMGVIVSPGTTQLSAKDILYRADAAGAKCVICNAEVATKLDAVRDELPVAMSGILVGAPRPDWTGYDYLVSGQHPEFNEEETAAKDPALCFFTSGTTGFPKMCIHSHDYAHSHINTGKYWLDLSPNDLHWNISDTGWAKSAWSSLFGPWNMGATVFVYQAVAFKPSDILRLLSEYAITTMCGAPTLYRLLVQENLSQFSFKALRHCVGAGEPLNPEIIETWKSHSGITIRDGYGQTETCLLCASQPSFEPRYGSMGKPAPGVDLEVIDESGSPCDINEEGDIAVRVGIHAPLGMFSCYRDDEERTAACFKGDFYITGDRAYKDEDGYFWFVGRADDVILSSGYRIGPFEVESALLEHEAIVESAVVSSPDKTRGEIVKAFIVLAQGYSPSSDLTAEIQDFVKNTTAPYKYPRSIEFVDHLPKTVSGKIRRIELRDREWAKVSY